MHDRYGPTEALRIAPRDAASPKTGRDPYSPSVSLSTGNRKTPNEGAKLADTAEIPRPAARMVAATTHNRDVLCGREC